MNSSRFRACLRALALLVGGVGGVGSAYSAVQATYYVSPRGSDENPGTEAMPFRTIAKARDVVRESKGTMTGDVVVRLRGGTYVLTEPVVFGPRDGGSDGHYVRYENYGDETPLLTGGQPIEGWTIHDQGRNIWKSTGVTRRFRQIYVDGTKGIRARLPNLGNGGSPNFYRLTKVDTNGRALNIASSYVSDWKNPTKVEMHLMIAWADATLRLASTTNMGSYTKVKIQDPEGTMLFNRPYPMLGVTFGDRNKQQCFYLENAFEFLDQAGEWYLDESDNVLYYMARPGEDMSKAHVVVPMLENLVTIEGSSTSDMVGYLSIKGLAFAHTTFMRPSRSGLLNLQAGQFNTAAPGGNKYMLWRPNSALTVTNAHHLRIERNLFAQLAASGIDFISGTRDNLIVGNVLTDLGGTGITVGKFAQDTLTEIHIPYNPVDKDEISTRDTVKNNLVTKVTTEIQGAIGIAAGYPRHLVIEHNEVSYTNYSGISVGFGWTRSPNAMTANKINWNHIHHVSQLLADAGNIYTLSNQGSGSQIQYNYMHDISGSPWADYWINGIYLDEGSSGFDVSHNVFARAPSGIACNSCGSYTKSDNEGSAASTISGAGIEPAYGDIKTRLTIPLANFHETPTGVSRDAVGSAANAIPALRIRAGRLSVRTGETVLSVLDPEGRKLAHRSIVDRESGWRTIDLSGERSGRYVLVLGSGESRRSVPFVLLR
ncbi:MAG: right-handed parallel beta-helix repeat-containing protein [Fibrobacteria bacterium]|nr:right-handed parallel beta-helix repeat-containing protein [Fibrobacteria bacterium]